MPYPKLLNFFPTPRFLKFSYVGVEITPSALRYAELFHDEGGLRLGKFGEKKFPTADISLNEDLRKALRELREKEGIQFAKCILPEEETYLFTADIEGTTEDEIRESIEFHLEENVPISGQDALFEFYVLPIGEEGKRQAAVSVVSRQTVAKYTDILTECGITAVSFMVESSSLSRAILGRYDLSTSLIVNLCEEKTVCAIVSQGFVQFSSTASAGGNIITEAIKKYYSIGAEEAKNLKHEKGLVKEDGNEEMLSVLMNAVSVLRDEVQKVSVYWQTHRDKSARGPIQKVILAGADAGIPGFADYLSASLKMDVSLADVWTNVPRYEKEVPPLGRKESLSFGPCLGLSLGGLL